MTQTDVERGEQDWRELRAQREAELVQPHGWLTLRGFHWLEPAATTLPGVPGQWSADDEEATLQADLADGLRAEGEPLDGTSTKTVAETGRVPWVTFGDTEVELLRRGGRLAVRMRTQTSPEREDFPGVETYDYDPAWVVPGRLVPYEDERRVDVATIRPDLRQSLRAVGEVEFAAGGQEQRLVVTSIKYGMSVEFHDPTNGDETQAWRQLKIDEPGPDGHVVLDFNRAINMWFAFTDYATCPAPTQGNTISVPVRAGERRFPRAPGRTN